MSLTQTMELAAGSDNALERQIQCFVQNAIIPQEPLLSQSNNDAKQCLTALSKQAKEQGLRGLYYPTSIGGKVERLFDYITIAESESYSEFGPAIFGSYSSLDAHMLSRFGSKAVKEQFLTPLVQGKAIPCFGMTEPNKSGSIPALMTSTASLENGEWVIQGGKWFISNANRASFMTAMIRTEADLTAYEAFSMLIIPTNAPGYKIKREISMLGNQQGQCEISFDQVRIPEKNILGARGQGMWLAGQRLVIGRLLRSAHWLGLANRCMDIMCERIHSTRGNLAKLQDKQLVRQHVFQCYQEILSARLMTLEAAKTVDNNKPDDVLINLAKFSAAKALSKAADSAVQLLGSDALDDQHPLSSIYRTARTTRILDGTDESLISSVGKKLINSHTQNRNQPT